MDREAGMMRGGRRSLCSLTVLAVTTALVGLPLGSDAGAATPPGPAIRAVGRPEASSKLVGGTGWAAHFEAGAASADITPPAWTTASDRAFVPVCGSTPAQVGQLWSGPRLFAFEKPYVDTYHAGRYVVGEPYCDADHTGRYEAPYLAGPPGQDHWPTAVDTTNPLQAQAVVYAYHQTRIAMVVVDSIGLFNVTMDQIRAATARLLAREGMPPVSQIFISSTHDETAPDPIGLWGPDASGAPVSSPQPPAGLTSGVDNYYLTFLARQAAGAVAAAEARLQPAVLRLAYAALPSNVQECWSSYPYIADQVIPVMQAVTFGRHRVIFTLVNGNSHVNLLAFDGVPTDATTFSADWAGHLRADLEADWPGSVGIEMSGLVGSVEIPTVYQPAATQVINVPGALHSVPGTPGGCSSAYPNPAGAAPVSKVPQYVDAYAAALAGTTVTALARAGPPLAVHDLAGQHASLCVQVENALYTAAFSAGLLTRPGYADPTCTVGSGISPGALPSTPTSPGQVQGANPVWFKTAVGVLTVGPAQFAYLPGEVFPVSAIRGPIDAAQMPFPTSCYDPASGSFSCGPPLPMTPWIAADMTQPYKFMAGLGEDMIGYMMPPGDFVGDNGETTEAPWAVYEGTTNAGNNTDRFGQGHHDDTEALGPHTGLAMTQAVASLLAADGPGQHVLPGLYLDAQGHTSDSPFATAGFTGAVGVIVVNPGGQEATYLIGGNATGWATFDGVPDPGTAGTALPYSVSTAGVTVACGAPLLVDVFAGATQVPAGAPSDAAPEAPGCPPPVVPEVPLTPLLPVVGLLAGGLVLGLHRRRRHVAGQPQ
ncbi:MAG: hypothetical protein ACYDB7_04895 [Mycobacteriales bacterium]